MMIDVFFDIVCPWCYIGKKRLEKMLDQRRTSFAIVRWRAFELNPGMPLNGMDRKHYLATKFGSAERAKRVYATINEAGEREGIAFRFNLIERTPNTLAAHYLVKSVRDYTDKERLIDRLFTAYFEQGIDIGTRDVLIEIAKETDIAIDWNTLMDVEAEVSQDLKARNQINGVPFYVFDNKYSMAGAQDANVLLRLYDLAATENDNPQLPQ